MYSIIGVENFLGISMTKLNISIDVDQARTIAENQGTLDPKIAAMMIMQPYVNKLTKMLARPRNKKRTRKA